MAARRVALLSLVVGALAAVGGAVAATGTPGTITTVAGTGVTGQTGDGGPASAAEIDHPRGIAFAPGGGYVFADAFANTVRRVWPDGHISTIAGTGDGRLLRRRRPGGGSGARPSARGRVHDRRDAPRRRRAQQPHPGDRPGRHDHDCRGNRRSGVRGRRRPGGERADRRAARRRLASGRRLPDPGQRQPADPRRRGGRDDHDGRRRRRPAASRATAVRRRRPSSAFPFAVAPTADGGLLIADTGNDRIRRVAPDGTITTVAGDGIRGYGGDGGPATQAALNSPHNLAVLPDGGFLIADEGNNRVRRVWPNGTITTVVGTGEGGFSGDGGPPAAAELNQPKAIAVLPDYQGFLLADAANSRVRLVAVDLRRILLLRPKTRTLRARRGHAAALVLTVDDAVTLRLRVRNGTRTVLRLREQGARRCEHDPLRCRAQARHVPRHRRPRRASATGRRRRR